MTAGKGEKRIPAASITAVQWKQPGAMVRGFIQFTMAGESKSVPPSESKRSMLRGTKTV